MVTINVAYSAPINPPPSASASPTQQQQQQLQVLTRAQVWQGLRLKVRQAPLFVGAIKTCSVIDDHESSDGAGGTVVRQITFGARPDEVVKEECKLFGPSRVDFHQSDGSMISNIISDGPSGRDSDMFMTYSFSWIHPDIDASDSGKVDEMTKKHKDMAKMAVDKSIEAIRRLVGDGTISS